jgi:MerR family transcriptional regulator, redox-sensitive transcriptional activator SoxR
MSYDGATLTIGELARRVGLNASAIRFYEREQLLPEPDREHGHRRYVEDAVRRLEVIDIAKRAGFTLEEIRLLLESSDAGDPAHERLAALAERKLPEVEGLIARAEAMRDWLEVARGCGCSSLDLCALFARRDPQAPATLNLVHEGAG